MSERGIPEWAITRDEIADLACVFDRFDLLGVSPRIKTGCLTIVGHGVLRKDFSDELKRDNMKKILIAVIGITLFMGCSKTEDMSSAPASTNSVSTNK